MSAGQHTPGQLWRSGLEIGTVPMMHTKVARVSGATIGEADANARRLVACWNACIDLSTDQIMQINGLLPARLSYQVMQRDREQLLEALQVARACIERDRISLAESHTNPHTKRLDADGADGVAEYDAVLRQVDEAISKATGSAN